MASISKDPGDRRRILFTGADGKRHAIRLGRVSQKVAKSVCRKVEALAACAISNTPWDRETSAWVAQLGSVLYDKLAAVDLVRRRQPEASTAETRLGDFLEAYIGTRANLKPNTRRNYEVTRKHLLSFFGPNRPLTEISAGDADEWREHLLGRGLSAATVSREVKRARQFFRAAVRKSLIRENPFADLPAPQQVNRSREHFVSRDVADRVIGACPDAEWRLIVALARYGGLRCPSEVLSLEWSDVDWGRNRVTVRSPKTEHHPDGATRQIPLFPELHPYLEAAWDLAQPGTRYVVTRYRDRNANLRTQFERIIRRAGFEVWPRLFQNLRASRETELTQHYPLHVVCAWIGNSQAVAAKHYLQVTEDHFRQAVTEGAINGAQSKPDGAQITTQPISASSGQERTETRKTCDSGTFWPELAADGQLWRGIQAPPRGVEPLLPD